MSKVVRFHQTGGPEVMVLEDVAVGEPGPGQVRLRQHAVGLNFIDLYHRSGLYPMALPSGLGMEAAGVVEAVGEGVSTAQVGDRVAYAGGPLGAYAEQRILPADKLVPLPDHLSFEQGASMLLQGLTAWYLLHQTYPLQAGETILFHAAAGGVGLIACQWAKALGATVIGTVSSPAKAELARQHGCDHVLDYSQPGWVAQVRELTGGKGVPVVYDGVGQATFMDSLDCLRQRGLMVSFGNASGAVPAIEPGVLSSKGSLYLTRPTLGHYTGTREALLAGAAALFFAVEQGQIKLAIHQRYPLAEVAKAHEDLAARRTTGSSVLLP
ncbi:quinone oxidoreductase family protein [Leeia aquatica]|uniref:Quinone oxidoreductase n=1 Tax=Leeia aquatica TaxID=2725557 RepID=A0A847S856_9NEIS|nr:quinone oxidoreductase [Leeia aquatica]NLR75943.1 quinone oxidoreductase [Leeia aquatica]